MQVLQPPSTQSYSDSEGHMIETFLFSTKPNEANWEVDKAFGHTLAKDADNKDFIIVPELIFKSLSENGGGHIWDWHTDEFTDLLKGYANHSHGKIKSKGPYFYGDGTDDYYYMANIKLNDSKAAAALMENGSKTWTKYAVSPHIFPTKIDNGLVKDGKFIGLALVIKGAYGDQAIVTKYCKGDDHVCSKSLGASSLCDKEDSLAASMISSLLSLNTNNDIMSVQVQEVPQVNSNVPKQEEVKQDNSKLEELELLRKQLADEQLARKEKEDIVTKLQNKDKTNTLNKIFGDVKDESIRKTLIDKYLTQDTDILNDFYQDINTHVFPSLVEAAKSQAEAELKNKIVEESKGKSKAGSLPKEPDVPKETEVVPNRVNEVKSFDRLMRGLQ